GVSEAKPERRSPIPGEERIARANREPADRAESNSESHREAGAPGAESEEGDIGWGPDRTVRRNNRPRPPEPRTGREEPAAVVIRRPAPRFIRNPGPAV